MGARARTCGVAAGRRVVGLPAAAILCALFLLAPAARSWAGSLNLTGTWQTDYHCQVGWCTGQDFPATDKLTQEEGSDVVLSSNGVETSEGVLTGFTLVIRGANGSYESESVVTVSSDGSSFSGTARDNNGTSGTLTGHILQAATIRVDCNLIDPGAGSPAEYFECAAEVADASGEQPGVAPTGGVSWALDPGGGGSFSGGDVCELTPSAGGGVSSCTVRYLPPAGGIPTNSQPPITAIYSGDARFATISGPPRSAIVREGPVAKETGPPPPTPLTAAGLLGELCAVAYSEACRRVAPEPPFLGRACLSLGGCGGDGGGSVTVTPRESALPAEASCPVSEGPLADCELGAYVESEDPDPSARPRAQYELDYRAYREEVKALRAAALAELGGASARLPREGGETEAARAALQAGLARGIGAWFGHLARRGTAASIPPVSVVGGAHACVGVADGADCLALLQETDRILLGFAAELVARKTELGLDAPLGARAQRDRLPVLAAPAGRVARSRQIVLGASGPVTLPAGRRVGVRIALTALARAKLRGARREGRDALRAQLVVRIATSSGACVTRIAPIVVYLAHERRSARAVG